MSDSSSDDDDIGVPLAQRLAGGRSALQSKVSALHTKKGNVNDKSFSFRHTTSSTNHISDSHEENINHNESDDDMVLSIVRTEPAPIRSVLPNPVNQQQNRSRYASVHTMSDSDTDDSETLPNITVPKTTASRQNMISNDKENERKQRRRLQNDMHAMSDRCSDDSEKISAIKSTTFLRQKVNNTEGKGKNQERKKRPQQVKMLDKDAQKRQRETEREEKRKMKELEAKRKRIEREQKRALNKNECMKVSLSCLLYTHVIYCWIFLSKYTSHDRRIISTLIVGVPTSYGRH